MESTKDLIIIAGKGAYPLLLAESARRQGVERLIAIAFRGETDRRLGGLVDELHWIHMGQLGRMLDAIKGCRCPRAVMAGQITPSHLFRVRMDGALLRLLKELKERNAETIFGAIGDEIRALGTELLPASSFMQSHIPTEEAVLTARPPSAEEAADIDLGLRIGAVTSGLAIGQTVILKRGTILAVEAFEGTDAAIRRAGKLGGPGAVVVKVAKPAHDMRFDIPVVGLRTLKSLRKAGVSALAIQSGRCILLEREAIIQVADGMGLSIVVRNGRTETA